MKSKESQLHNPENKAQNITPEINNMAQKAIEETYIYDERFIWIELPAMDAMSEITNLLYEKNLLHNITIISVDEGATATAVFSRSEIINLLKDEYPNEVTLIDNDEENNFWRIQINNLSHKADISYEIRSLLEQKVLGYRRLIEQSDIENTKQYSDAVLVHKVSNPKAFQRCIKTAHDENPHGAFLNIKYSADDYSRMQMFIVNTGAAGLAVKPDGDIVSVFKNLNIACNDNIGKVNRFLMYEALKAGGKKLDCFDGKLSKLYGELGFVPICKLKFNDERAPEGWNFERDGRPDIVFMVYIGDSTSESSQLNTNYPPITEALLGAPYVNSYEQAAALIDEY